MAQAKGLSNYVMSASDLNRGFVAKRGNGCSEFRFTTVRIEKIQTSDK